MIENPFTWFYFPTALTLGALHALEPGHAKTLTAAYLIGIRGTKRDALLLGLSVAFTHSLVVIAISVAALWLGRQTFTQDVTHWLQLGSGGIVVCLGFWLMVKRIRQMKKANLEHLHPHHHGAPDPVQIENDFCRGTLEIIQTDAGERFRFQALDVAHGSAIRVLINRTNGLEVLEFMATKGSPAEYISLVAPEEPHEFSAEFEIRVGDKHEVFPFEMHESGGHHDHHLMSDDEHARAHAATIPDYAKRGERPTWQQILAFGAAGGMIPCPASITVMLLSLSIGKFASGLLAVAGFSLGLAVTLVGIGLIVVAGLNQLKGSGRFNWVSAKAPVVSAGVVMLSGLAALLFAH